MPLDDETRYQWRAWTIGLLTGIMIGFGAGLLAAYVILPF